MHTIQLQKSIVAVRGRDEAYPQLSFSHVLDPQVPKSLPTHTVREYYFALGSSVIINHSSCCCVTTGLPHAMVNEGERAILDCSDLLWTDNVVHLGNYNNNNNIYLKSNIQCI